MKNVVYHTVNDVMTLKTENNQEILQIVTNKITPRALFSPLFLQSCSSFHDGESTFQRYIHSKFS